MEEVGFVGVHVGAGKYSEKGAHKYEKLCRQATKRAVDVLRTGKSSLDAVAVATAILENSTLANAGFGSNLTIDGHVECDASIMNGYDLTFGAVGAVTCVRNPIYLAKKLCSNQNEDMPLGRIPPCVLVGQGADSFARKYADIATVFPESLISPNALKLYQKYKGKLDNFYDRLDTVGAVAIDSQGRMAAASSSGGILLKESGRIGQAAMFGCGCWAEDKKNLNEASVAVTTSGCGEYIMKTLLARQIGNSMKTSTAMNTIALSECIRDLFLNSHMLRNVQEKLCGVLVLKHDGVDGELLWAHTTHSFCVGYMSMACKKAKSRLSSLSHDDQIGKTVVVESVPIYSVSI